MTRLFFLLLFLIGIGVAFVYPLSTQAFSGHEIGSFRAYDAAAGFQQVTAKLEPTDTPVAVTVDLAAVVPADGIAPGESVLTVTAAFEGRTVLAGTLDLSKAEPREDSPQTAQRIWRIPAGSIAVDAAGDYVFVVGPGDAEGVHLTQVDLILRGSSVAYRESAKPIGLSLLAVGFIGFVISLRRPRRTETRPGNEPPKPRWGRGAADR